MWCDVIIRTKSKQRYDFNDELVIADEIVPRAWIKNYVIRSLIELLLN